MSSKGARLLYLPPNAGDVTLARMPRANRGDEAGGVYHALNRGNGRQRVFHAPADYAAFVDLLGEAARRVPVRVLTAWLMPNHVHLVLWPGEAGAMGRFMQWLFTSHVRRHHRRHPAAGGGHVWQGRYKSFPIEADAHLYAVLRYVERNPVRAGLAASAADWPWGSAAHRRRPPGLRPAWLSPWPEEAGEPADWLDLVDRPETEAELAAIGRSLRRGSPFGSDAWRARTAARLGLRSTLRPRGRPRKSADDTQVTLIK